MRRRIRSRNSEEDLENSINVYEAILYTYFIYRKQEQKPSLESADSFFETAEIAPSVKPGLKKLMKPYWKDATKVFKNPPKWEECQHTINDFDEINNGSWRRRRDDIEISAAAKLLEITEEDEVLDLSEIRSSFLEEAGKSTRRLSGMADAERPERWLPDALLNERDDLPVEILAEDKPPKNRYFSKIFNDRANWTDLEANIIRLLSENGKAVVIASADDLSDSGWQSEAIEREVFIKKGYIEAVVRLDSDYLILLSKEHTEGIIFVDATDLIVENEDDDILTDEVMIEIKNRLSAADTVPLSRIGNNEWRLLPWDYKYSEYDIFLQLTDKIGGNEDINDDDEEEKRIKEFFTDLETGIYYLERLPRDAVDKASLPRLREIPEKVTICRNWDIIEGRRTAEIIDWLEENETLIVKRDLDVYRITEDIDPWYLQKMIDIGEHGDSLSEMRIPRLSREDEERIGEEYRELDTALKDAEEKEEALLLERQESLRQNHEVRPSEIHDDITSKSLPKKSEQ
ncbi:MAG: hypothetical protein IK083_06180 [Abditibacteriota bacterium]|nr:hypothetical protein [Abditibacteriota bacterium]